MDVLSDILDLLHIRGTVYFKKDFYGPWGMSVPASGFAQFHMVARGHCLVKHANFSGWRTLEAGDCILFFPGQTHSLADSANSPLVDGQKIVEAHLQKAPVFSSGERACTLVCGHFAYDGDVNHPLVESLPPYILLQSAGNNEAYKISKLLDLIMMETGSGQPGWGTSVKRLAEILFIQMIRYYILNSQTNRSFVKAMQKPSIYRALQFLHKDFSRSWSLEQLARQVGISRTALANHFKQTVDMTVMAYLAQWRMLRARELLLRGEGSIAGVAEKVGYQSETSFNKAFKKQFRQTPGAFRRGARSQNTL